MCQDRWESRHRCFFISPQGKHRLSGYFAWPSSKQPVWPLLSGLCSVRRLKLGCCWTPCNAPVLQIRSIDFQRWSKISPERKCPSCSHPFLLPVILGRLSLSLVRKLIWCGSWRGHFHRAIWNTSCLLSSSARKATERTVGSHLSFMFNFFFPLVLLRFPGVVRTWKSKLSFSPLDGWV